MRVRAAECAALHYDGGKLIWDGYLVQQQFALTPASERVLRFFADWRELDDPDGPDGPVARHLLRCGLLIEEGSAAHAQEVSVLARWGSWGPAARYQHFSARTPAGTGFLTLDADQAQAAEQARRDPPPPPFKSYSGASTTAVPTDRPTSTGWARPLLVDALFERRSTRRFADAPLTLEEIGALVHTAGGVVDRIDHPDTGPTVFKTSPSAGGRDPIELYLHVRDVTGLSPGLYHFAPGASVLEHLGPAMTTAALTAAVGGQSRLAEAPVLLLYTAVLERTAWRYPTRRAYRDILVGFGHVSQTVLVTASAMGLGAVTATAVVDEAFERLLGCDPVAEPVLGVTALGRPG